VGEIDIGEDGVVVPQFLSKAADGVFADAAPRHHLGHSGGGALGLEPEEVVAPTDENFAGRRDDFAAEHRANPDETLVGAADGLAHGRAEGGISIPLQLEFGEGGRHVGLEAGEVHVEPREAGVFVDHADVVVSPGDPMVAQLGELGDFGLRAGEAAGDARVEEEGRQDAALHHAPLHAGLLDDVVILGHVAENVEGERVPSPPPVLLVEPPQLGVGGLFLSLGVLPGVGAVQVGLEPRRIGPHDAEPPAQGPLAGLRRHANGLDVRVVRRFLKGVAGGALVLELADDEGAVALGAEVTGPRPPTYRRPL